MNEKLEPLKKIENIQTGTKLDPIDELFQKKKNSIFTSLDQIMNFVELEIDIYSRSPDTHKLFELAERLKGN